MRQNATVLAGLLCVALCVMARPAWAQDGEGFEVIARDEARFDGDEDREPERAFRGMIGWPWIGWRFDYGISERLIVYGEVDSAQSTRVQPMLGVRWDLARSGLSRLGVEVGAGYQRQRGELAQRGPSFTALVGGELGGQHSFVYGWLKTRHTVLLNERVVETVGGEERSFEAVQRWTPSMALGVGTRVGPIALSLGLDWRLVDVGYVGFSIPGFHTLLTMRF